MKIKIYAVYGGYRARTLGEAMQAGLLRHGVRAEVMRRDDGKTAGLAIAYGWRHESIFRRYLAAGARYLFWDLGYFGRGNSRMIDGCHHRFALDNWDTAQHMPRGMPGDRFGAHRIPLRALDRVRGDNVFVVGMSDKAAGTHGFRPRQWETAISDILSSLTRRPIIQRPKVRGSVPIAALLESAHMVVTHHSNVALDAVIAGVPFLARKGVGALLSPLPGTMTVEQIERPHMFTEIERQMLLYDVSYAQWTPAEMRSGRAWDFIRGLL